MVLGLGGAALPPRPAKRHIPATAAAGGGGSSSTAAGAAPQESSLVRVHSNSHLAAALAAAGVHTVDTPSAEQQPALPAASGQSNVRGGAVWRAQELQQEVQQQVQQLARARGPQHEQSASECDQPSPQQQQVQPPSEPPAQEQHQAAQLPLLQQRPQQQGSGAEQLVQVVQREGVQPQPEQQQQPAQQMAEQQRQQAAEQLDAGPVAGVASSPTLSAQQQVQQGTEQEQQLQDASTAAKQGVGDAAGAGRKRRAEQPAPAGTQGVRSRRARLGSADAAGPSSGDAAAEGERRGSRRLAAAAGAAAAPAAKRQKQKPAGSVASKGASGASGGSKPGGSKAVGSGRSKFADVLHRVVAVPGSVFFVDTPGKFYFGQVTKSEPKRKVPAVEVLFCDDDSKYWFPVADVRGWMAAMAAAGPHQPHAWAQHNPGVPPPAPEQQAASGGAEEVEEEAAKALQSLSVSVGGSQLTGSQVKRGEPAVSSGGKGGRRASGAGQGGGRERPPSRGGRPGAAGGPLRRTDSQERREGALMAAVQAESR